MKLFIAIAITLAMSINVYADSYRGEIVGGFTSGSASGSYSPPDEYVPPIEPPVEPVEPPLESESFSSSEDYEGWGVAGRLYLQPVDTGQGPLALLPFLQRTDHVGISLSNKETDSGAKTDRWDADTRFVLNNFVLEASYGQTDTEAFGSEANTDQWRAAVGYYVAQNTQVRGTYEFSESLMGDDNTRYVMDITHVQSLNNGATWAANALVGWVEEDFDDGTDINLLFDWFFNDNFNVGTELTYNTRDIAGDVFGYELHGEYFVNDYASVRLAYFNQDYDDAGLEADAFVFEVLYRH